MFFFNHYFFISLALQAVCAIHCLRKGNQNKWIWIIIFLPFIGCLIYFFTEILSEKDLQVIQSGISQVLSPGTGIKRLEQNLRFSDTFSNRVVLADAYLAIGETQKAIELYESSLTGNFSENEQVLKQLIAAYFIEKRFEDVIVASEKIYVHPQFARSASHIYYAIALEQAGDSTKAEQEFLLMKARFSNYEARYHYGLFLERKERKGEAKEIFAAMADEYNHLSPAEKRSIRQWISLSKEELKKMTT